MTNLVNLITFSRILLAPFILAFLMLDNFLICLLLFIFAGITDYFDGYLARKYNAESQLGEILDPIADKILVIFILFGLSVHLHSYLIAFLGSIILTREILVVALRDYSSRNNISNKMKLDVGDDLVMYYVQKPTRVRKFKVIGIYNTGLAEFDEVVVIGDLKHIQKLNNWEDNQVGGYEVITNNISNIELFSEIIDENIDYDLKALDIKQKYPQIFDWLRLQDFNVLIILILMLIVGGVNMITSLLIIILEKSRLIGILKAIGATNWNIRNVFIYNSLYIIFNGLLWGNLIALTFSICQNYFDLISLDENIYFMSFVPVKIELMSLFLINIGTIIICYLILVIPSVVISKISPAKSIKFE